MEKYYKVEKVSFGHWKITLEVGEASFKLITTDSQFIDDIEYLYTREQKQSAIDERFFSQFEDQIDEFERYVVRCTENGDEIDTFYSLDNAKGYLKEIEDEDKLNGNFEPNFYEIYDLLTCEAV